MTGRCRFASFFVCGWITPHALVSLHLYPLLTQKIRTIELEGKTIKLQIVRAGGVGVGGVKRGGRGIGKEVC